jgi:PAS domain S-box-containing protein
MRSEGEARYQNVLAQACGALATGFGLIALLGWVLKLPLLSSFGSRLIPMAPSTALLFIIMGTAIYFQARLTQQNRAADRMGLALGALTAFVSLPLLSLSSQGIYLEVERLGLQINGGLNITPLGHMSPVTALSFLLVSLSFLILLSSSSGHPRRVMAAWVLAILVILANYVFVLAYFVGLPLLYAENTIPPALPTSLAFLALGMALLASTSAQTKPQDKIKEAGSTPVPSAIFLVFIFLALSIVTVGYLYYRNSEQLFRTQMERQLSAIADLKVNGLVSWRKERLADADMLYQNPAFTELVAQSLEKPAEVQAQKQLQAWLDKFLVDGQYERVSLLDTHGLEQISAPASPAPVSAYLAGQAAATLNSGQVTFADFHRNTQNGPIYLALLVPIFAGQEVSRPLGVLILQIDPHTYLYPFLQEWPAPSQSAETLLTHRDGEQVVYLNQLRFGQETALNLSFPLTDTNLPAVRAVLGETGIFEGVDYRGKTVIADLRAVPASPWFLVFKKDTTEVFAPLRERLWQTILLFGVLVLATGVGLMLAWRQQRVNYYRARFETAESLRKSQEQYRELIEHASDGIFIADANWKYVEVNPSGCAMLGYTRDEILSKQISELIPPEDAAATPLHLDELRQGKTLLTEQRLIRKDGSLLPVEISGRRLPDGRFQSIVRDITERKQAEEKLIASEVRYRRLFEAARDGILILDAKTGQVVDVNPFLVEMLGFSREEFLGKELWELGFFKDIAANKANFLELQQKEYIRYEDLPLETTNGRKFHVEFVSNIYQVNHHKVVQCNIRDITERKQAEEALRESQEKFRIAQDMSPDGFTILRPVRDAQERVVDFTWVYENAAVARLNGTDPEAVVGRRLLELFPSHRGTPFLRAYQQVAESGETCIFESGYSDESMTKPTSFRIVVVPMAGDIAILAQDITERKRAEQQLANYTEHLEEMVDERTRELRTTHEQLVRQERLATLGQVAGSIGHELRNPLGVISNAIYYLKMSQPEASGKTREYLDIIEKETRASDKIVTDLLDFTRVKSVDREPASVSKLVNQTLERYPVPPPIQVTLEIPADLPKVFADPQQVVQVLGNLVANACQAMISHPIQGQAGFRQAQSTSSTTETGTGKRIKLSAFVHNDMIMIAVQDTGSGIPLENMAKLFQPLFTTKSKGIGLGLAVSKKLAEANGGRIEVESVVGQGSTFSVCLPLFKESK